MFFVPEKVSLTVPEWQEASQVGLLRYQESRRRDIENTSCSEDHKKIAHDMLGACAEAAFCKWRGVVWEKHVNTGHRVPDVYPFFEIRGTDKPHGRLPVRKNDANDRLYVLVTVVDLTYTFRGWMGGGGAKRDEWWDDPRNLGKPCWWVPQSELYDPRCLKL